MKLSWYWDALHITGTWWSESTSHRCITRINGAFIFHLFLVSTICWTNNPLPDLLVIRNAGTYMWRQCTVIIFGSDGPTVNTFQILGETRIPRHCNGVTWATWCLKSQSNRLYVQESAQNTSVYYRPFGFSSQGASEAENYPCHDVISNTQQRHMNRYQSSCIN